MKIRLFALLLAGSAALAGCSSCGGDDNIPPPSNGNTEVDETLTYKSVEDTGSYETFFKPNQGWVGDPMPYYNTKEGTYYIFYLQDWRDGRINDHPVCYTTTKNYGTFTGFSEAIPTVADTQSQELLIGTGSFIEKGGVYYCYYTGHNGNLNPAEKIMIATSANLKSWTKQPSLTFHAPIGYDANNFRDPHVYYDPTRECYVMLVTSIKDGKGCFARYTSTNMTTWTNIEPLTEFESDAQILECPDIFQMGDKWYLTFSRINRDRHRKTFYRVADSPDGPWSILRDDDGHHETFDGLFMYAAKTASDGTNRYISGWCSTAERVNDGHELDWAGALVTHKLVQRATGRLYPEPVAAVLNKFVSEAKYKALVTSEASVVNGNFTVDEGGKVVFNRNTSSFKIIMKIDAAEATRFGIAFAAHGEQAEAVKIEFDLDNSKHGIPCLVRYNAVGDEITFTPLEVPDDKRFDVTVVAEKTVCTLYVNGTAAFTNRILKMNQNPWMIYSASGTATFSDIAIYK